ncbi:MAG: flagellar hook-associated protein FlgK [Myxococcota bacterium]|nr:flagellar hook-associated protein FlgK [Myxococcota bacterium]
MPTISLFGTLHTAREGMAAQQAGIHITGQNTANVNTEGYSRRRLMLASRPGPPYGGAGVSILGFKRYSDTFANDRLIEEEVLGGNSKQRSDILTHVSELFNDLEDTGMGSSLDALFGAFRLLESNPADPTAREEVLARAYELASTFNRISNGIEAVRANSDNLLKATVTDINTYTEEIARLNQQILLAQVTNQDTADVLDKRDQLIRELSKLANISVITNDENQVTVFLEGGRPLVEDANQSLLQVTDSGGPGAARVMYIMPSGVSSDITTALSGGALGGIIEVRDTLLPGYQSDLDQLAYDIATGINTQHMAGVGLDGVGGRRLFGDLTTSTNAASLIAVDAAVTGNTDAIAAALDPTLLPGDNRNALALAALADQDLATGATQTFNEAYVTIVGSVGVETRRANDEAAMRQTSISHIEAIRDSQSGVSLDEEMNNLIQYQRAYQASARVLNAVNEVLQALISLGT